MRGAELRRRLTDIPWLLSQAQDLLLDARDTLARGDFARLNRIVRSRTMCGNARLRGLYGAVQRVVARNIPGDLVECGTARGGSAALMGLAARRLGASRTLWAFDTFEGLPCPTDGDPDREVAELYTGRCRGDLGDVRAFFDRLGLLPDVRLVKGRFQDTLAVADVKAIAVLHLDCDWYESVRVCLDQLYDRVSPGGVIQIDDYGHWAGARKAVDEFLGRRLIDARLRRLDYTGRQFTKP
jgi:hypothetical protein